MAGLLAVLIIAALAALGEQPHGGELDPRDAGPAGARALAVLLAERGVPVSITGSVRRSSNPTPDTTILLSRPDLVSVRALHRALAGDATVVLVDPPAAILAASGVPATADAEANGETVPPGCGLPVAETAGTVRLTGTLYAVTGAATSCYRENGDASLVVTTRPSGGRTVVLGSASTLTNADLAKQGDAALAIGLLRAAQLRWVPAGLADGAPPSSQQGLLNLLPRRVVFAVFQLMIALVVLALWRARRLGKPIAEPLPVIVRAAETVEGRARLLRASRSRGTAARALRAASIERLTRALRLGADEQPDAVVSVVAEASRTPAADVRAVLYGDEPANDAALVAACPGPAEPGSRREPRRQRPGGPHLSAGQR